jgi:phosphate-selective porin OprO/OprP
VGALLVKVSISWLTSYLQRASGSWAYRWLIFSLLLICGTSPIYAEGSWNYGGNGNEWSDQDSGSYVWLGLRAQLRASNLQHDFHSLEDFEQPNEPGVWVNRARYKIGAGYRDKLTFYHEYDLRSSRLLDLRTTWVSNSKFRLRAGQWKAEYNRARVDSSGKQQFVERSIATYWFTIDRQWGLSGSGRFGEGESWDSSWWAGVLGGNGRSESSDGGRPMLFGRWQWNYTGNVLPFSQSALSRYDDPRGSLSFGFVSNDSKYTRYSSGGGGSLPGYQVGEDNQYRILQAMQEWAWHHRGYSVQQELHIKQIEDQVMDRTDKFWGGYIQGGWFPSANYANVPEALELALRGGYVDTGRFVEKDETEFAFVTNWFLNGHRNKISAEVAHLQIHEENEQETDWRFRLQWELSI